MVVKVRKKKEEESAGREQGEGGKCLPDDQSIVLSLVSSLSAPSQGSS